MADCPRPIEGRANPSNDRTKRPRGGETRGASWKTRQDKPSLIGKTTSIDGHGKLIRLTDSTPAAMAGSLTIGSSFKSAIVSRLMCKICYLIFWTVSEDDAHGPAPSARGYAAVGLDRLARAEQTRRPCRQSGALTMLHDCLTTSHRSNAGFLSFMYPR
jgi:hypothetical protein